MIEKQLILDKTSGGYRVFEHYLGKARCEKKLFRNPYREDDNASCHIYCKEGLISGSKFVFKDFGDSEWYGDCFWFVAKIFNRNLKTDFREVLRIIDRDLNLNLFPDLEPFPDSSPVLKSSSDSDTSSHRHGKTVGYRPLFKSFSSSELQWWQRYGITADILNRYGVRSLQSCVFTREDGSSFTVGSDYKFPFYGYSFKDGMKFYRPGSKTRFLYGGILPKPYIFGFDQLPAGGKHVFITGGEKDVMTLAAHGYPAICMNCESARIPSSLCDTLSKRFTHLFVLYDSDKTGIRESALRVKDLRTKYPVYRLVLPLAGTKSAKDISDYFLLGNSTDDFEKLIAKSLRSSEY